MQKAQYKDATDTGSGPSPSIWGNCPVLDFILDPAAGTYFFDDFIDIPVITTPTITTEAAWGGTRYKAFGSAGGTLVSGGSLNGDVVLTETDDDQGVSIATIALPFKIIIGGGNLWFEARIKTNSATNTKHGFFLGLMDSATLSATVPIAADGTLADENLVGFHRLEGDGDKVDTVYKADGVTAVTVGADAATIAADTYIKLGIKYDDSTNILSFYADGAKLADTKTIPSAAGTDFPNDVTMGLVLAMLCASNDDAIVTMDWWRCAQQRVS